MKYPRTYHLPFSPGASNDDKVLKSIDHLLCEPLVVTEKLDGSNVCMSKEGCFARSHSGPPSHPSFDAFKALYASVKYLIPENIYLYGEWCFAKHSIFYNKLLSYLFLFGVKNVTTNVWLSWLEVNDWAKLIRIPTVPIINENITFTTIKDLETFVTEETKKTSACGLTLEGIVLRKRKEIADKDFSQMVTKWVRKEHVKTSTHWKHQEMIRNRLRKSI